MTTKELRRSNVQALWRHLPDQPYNWGTEASVLGRSPRHTTQLDIPEGWVAGQLRRLVEPFASAVSGIPGAGRELDLIDAGAFQLVQAEDLQAERFPNTFLCQRCGRFKGVQVGDSAPTCPVHGTMRQHSFAEVHQCGHLAELRAPRCGSGCNAPMRLMNTAAFNTWRWYWQCSRCQARASAPITRWCPTCARGTVRISRVPQTSAYYPQQLTVLNPPTRDTYAALAHENVHPAAVAQALGVLSAGLDALRRAGQPDAADAIAQVEATAALLGWKPGDALYDQAMTDARAKAGSAPAWRAEVDALGLTPERLDALGEECRQLSLIADAASLSVDDLAAAAAGTSLEPLYDEYRPLFDTYGLADVTLLRQLPVAFVVAGYTRESSGAWATDRRGVQTPTQFRFFPPNSTGRFPMYGVRTETEGLLVQLDPLRVVTWLVDSGVVADPGVSTAAAARRWLFTAMDPVTSIFEAPANPVSAAVLGLTHSVSHRMMKALAARCGLNVDSLAEYLLPSNAAVLIYANTRSEFILGGLEHVFRYDLPDALTELDAESRCVFDPPCRHAFGGACAACLHVSEVACCRFNTVLDRNLLFGSLPDPAAGGPSGVGGGITWHPFWTA
jgi:hypothetical protein